MRFFIGIEPECLGVICQNGLAVEEYAPTRWNRWAERASWKIFKHWAGDANHEYAMIDSTIVRAHQHSAGAQKCGEAQP